MIKHANSIFTPDPTPLSVALLLLNETSLLAVAATIDPMRAANRLANRTLFSWTVATPDGAPALLTSAVSFPANVALRDVPKADVLLVLAGFNHQTHAPANLTLHLRRIAATFRAIGSVDSGGWVLARAGLLDGHQATVHWEDLDEFSRRFPNIDVVPDRFVISKNRFSAGGAVPAMDFMLHLIRSRYGASLAVQVASAFIYDDIHHGQEAQKSVSQTNRALTEPAVARAIQIMADRIEEPLTMRRIAGMVGVSLRQLEMKFQTALGISPGKYGTDLRLQMAARLARDTALSFTDISLRSGFASQASFARAFKTAFALTPGNYRKSRGTLLRPIGQKTK